MHVSKLFLILANGLLQVVAQTPTTPTTTDRPTLSWPFHTSCMTVMNSVQSKMGGAPGPDMAISELAVSFAIGGYHNTKDNCELPVVTGKDAKLFSEWASSWTSYQSEHISEYREIWSACSKEPQVEDIIPVGPEWCTELVAAITGDDSTSKDTTKATPTTGGSAEEQGAKETGASTTESDSPGSRQTGGVVGAGVVAGILVAGLY